MARQPLITAADNANQVQGVIAHEYSHVLNGDMRLNIRLMGVLFGLAPSLQFSRPDLQGPLREGRGTTSRRGQLARQGLVVAQIALALVILASAGLIFRSFSGLRQADLFA